MHVTRQPGMNVDILDKPRVLLDEDHVIGAMTLGIAAGKIRITPIARVFAK